MQPSRLRVHVQKRHSRQYSCSHAGCTEVFALWTQLLKHRASVHVNLTCHVCQLTLKNRDTFTKHMKTHASAKTFPCPIAPCAKVFSRATNLRVHIRSAHEKEKPFVCSVCDAAFAYKKTLDQHNARGHLNSVWCFLLPLSFPF